MDQSHLKGRIIVVVCITLFSAAYSGLSLFKPQLLTTIVQHEHSTWDSDEVESKASFYKSFLDGASAVVGLFALPILGSLSDVFGRKIIMIVSLFSLPVTIFIYYLTYVFNNLWLLYSSCLFSFQMGAQITIIAYMSDIAEDEKQKTSNFGVILAAYMAGTIIGSFGIGALGNHGLELSLYVVFGISIMPIIVAFFFHEHTQFYAERIHRKFDIKKGNPFSAMLLIFCSVPFVGLMAIVYTINFLAISDTSTFFLYTENRYGWQSFENGLSGAIGGVSSVLCQGIGVAILLRFFSRTGILTFSMFVAFAVNFLQGWSPVGWLFMVGIVVSGLAAIGFPLMQSLFSEQIPSEQQGMAFGGLSSLSSIASLVGELATENTFSYCLVKEFFTCPGTAFYICAFLYLVDAAICFVLYLKYPEKEKKRKGYVSLNADEDEQIKV
eukprot:Phypoly_transcript_09279.p1 GENE.Phypoly_transcript_09279~~Phypoly_transcript_09279.p1  ORF type:complete len:466 (+),score=28.82 Phypoly_transcript_09279:82-1398(+)